MMNLLCAGCSVGAGIYFLWYQEYMYMLLCFILANTYRILMDID